MKYQVLRSDNKDNSDELYVVVRVDLNAKHFKFNIQQMITFASKLCKIDEKQGNEILDLLVFLKIQESESEIEDEYMSYEDEYQDMLDRRSIF